MIARALIVGGAIAIAGAMLAVPAPDWLRGITFTLGCLALIAGIDHGDPDKVEL